MKKQAHRLISLLLSLALALSLMPAGAFAAEAGEAAEESVTASESAQAEQDEEGPAAAEEMAASPEAEAMTETAGAAEEEPAAALEETQETSAAAGDPAAKAHEIQVIEETEEQTMPTLLSITQSTFDSKLNELRAIYPNYSTWTDYYDGGHQCWGFARLVADYVFGGDCNSQWSTVYSISNVKAGDILQYGNTSGSGHTVFVTSVSGDTITFVDCNGNGNYSGGTQVRTCGIKWDNTISKSGLMFGLYSFSYLLSSPGISGSNTLPKGWSDAADPQNGSVYVKGWAYDPDSPSTAVAVHVYCDSQLLGSLTANKYHEGVDAQEHCGDYHGYEGTFSVPAGGSHTIYVYAIDANDANSHTLLTATAVTIPTLTTTLTLNGNGGSPSSQSVTLTYGSNAYSGIADKTPSRSGYTFAGWYTAASGGTKVYGSDGLIVNEGTYWKDSKSIYTKNYTLYAHWTGNKYTLTLNANGGTPEIQTVTTTYGTTYYDSLYSQRPTREGYTLAGWYTAKTGGTQIYGANSGIVNDGTYWKDGKYAYAGDLTLYAHWTANKYILTLDANGGTPETQTVTMTYGTTYYDSLYSQRPAREGYTLAGWYTAKTGGTQIYGANSGIVNDGTYWKDGKYVYAGDLTLYAQWTKDVMDIADCDVTVTDGACTYNGEEHCPEVIVTYGSTPLVNGTDYTVSYSNNINAGTATAMITGMGKYSGEKEVNFEIAKGEQPIQYTISSTELLIGESTSITASAEGAITYSSSNDDVVMVSKSGKVVAAGLGTASIIITAAETENYNAGRVSISITVTDEEAVENPFVDIHTTNYYYDSVLWAYTNGITTGRTVDGKVYFMPTDSCTRAQAVTFLWRAAGQPEPSTKTNPFSDISTSSYYYKAVLWAYENGITTGKNPGSGSLLFAPNDTCTRAQIVTFLWRTEGKPGHTTSNPFTDVANGGTFTDAILWAYENGITTGRNQGDGSVIFMPNDYCTRAQIVTFLYRDMKV